MWYFGYQDLTCCQSSALSVASEPSQQENVRQQAGASLSAGSSGSAPSKSDTSAACPRAQREHHQQAAVNGIRNRAIEASILGADDASPRDAATPLDQCGDP
mmetsp:Transcript_11342/g.30414  ORF Transcript_11342/g.30414 Transcript_11342/m.30414 type:complete len:102 (+) Transcript_11342:701-1006(+)